MDSAPTPYSLPSLRIFGNAARHAAAAAPIVSVVIPFYDTSPAPLVVALLAQAATLAGSIEILVADDGSPRREPGQDVQEILAASRVPAALLTAPRNIGRARIRNALAQHARGEWLLYVDCDMQPGSTDYLTTYLACCADGAPDIVYGGFVIAADAASDDSLAAYFGRRSDCVPVERRRADPAKWTFTNNLLVRRTVMLATPFDERFSGWGWEDVEWALRAAERWTIHHIDNPVVNPGWSSAAEIVEKFGGSARNFALLIERHPVATAGYPLYRASRIARRLPFAGLAARLLRAVALNRGRIWPLSVRYHALKLYRACMYRDVALSAKFVAASRTAAWFGAAPATAGTVTVLGSETLPVLEQVPAEPATAMVWLATLCLLIASVSLRRLHEWCRRLGGSGSAE